LGSGVPRRWLALGLASLLLLAIGLAIGRGTTESERPEARPAVTITVPAPASERGQPESETRPDPRPSGYARTPDGAVAAATAYVAELGGPNILDPAAMRRTLTAIASTTSRDNLVRAYESAASHARDQLGVRTATDPDIVLRASSVGYRVDGFQRATTTVSIWRVGIVGSSATVEPRQSWRTETVSLVWEDGTWKVDAVRSSPGPTPPLAGPAATPAELFATMPRFEEFTRELP
jgi:hypothetical protein